MGAEKVAELTEQFAGRLAFAQGASGDNLVVIQKELLKSLIVSIQQLSNHHLMVNLCWSKALQTWS